jgi:hypothetical protein
MGPQNFVHGSYAKCVVDRYRVAVNGTGTVQKVERMVKLKKQKCTTDYNINISEFVCHSVCMGKAEKGNPGKSYYEMTSIELYISDSRWWIFGL